MSENSSQTPQTPVAATDNPPAGLQPPTDPDTAPTGHSDLFVCLDHVGLAVPDLDEAIRFHTEVLGWRLLHREENQEQGVAEAMMGTGEQAPQSAQIQLLAPLDESSTIAKFLSRSGPGMQQLAYRVRDVDAVCQTLRERGVRLLFDEPRRGTAGSRINFAHPKDTGGVLLELVEPAAGH